MKQQMQKDATTIQCELRRTEGALDDALLRAAGLMETLVRARQNPDVAPHAGQRAIMSLTRAMQRQVEAANNIFRVHDQMVEVGLTYGVLDRDKSTPLSGFSDNEAPVAVAIEEAA
jgi:hypothetical protein